MVRPTGVEPVTPRSVVGWGAIVMECDAVRWREINPCADWGFGPEERGGECDRVRCSWTQNWDLNWDKGFSLDRSGSLEEPIATR